MQLETMLNDENAAAATNASRRAGTGVGDDTGALSRPTSFNGDDATWRDWSAVFRSYVGLINTSLTHAEAAGPVALVIGLQVDETILEASLDLYHLLLHLTTAPALDRVVTSGDREGFKAWHSPVAGWDPKRKSRMAGNLLELWRPDFRGDLLCKMEEYERAVLALQNTSGETVSSAMKVGVVLNRLRDSELAAHSW